MALSWIPPSKVKRKPLVVEWRASFTHLWMPFGEASTEQEAASLERYYINKFPGQTRTVKRNKK